MGCLTSLVELFGLEVVLEAIWDWLSSFSWHRRPDVPKRDEKPDRPDPPKRISRGGRR